MIDNNQEQEPQDFVREKSTPVYDAFVKHGFQQEAVVLQRDRICQIGYYVALIDTLFGTKRGECFVKCLDKISEYVSSRKVHALKEGCNVELSMLEKLSSELKQILPSLK